MRRRERQRQTDRDRQTDSQPARETQRETEILQSEKHTDICYTIRRRQRERERESECVQTSDGLLYFGHRPIYKPQNTKLNYAHRQTNKTYKKQNTQTNKTDINKQTNNKQKQQTKERPTKTVTRG